MKDAIYKQAVWNQHFRDHCEKFIVKYVTLPRAHKNNCNDILSELHWRTETINLLEAFKIK